MKVVLDTNVLLVSIPRQSKYRPIFEGLIQKKYTLIISNEILMEYEEILARKANDLTAQNIIKMLVTLSNVEKTEVYYRWDLIESDKDDNKFVDCAITGNVDYLVVFWCRAKSCCWTRFARPGVIRYFEHHLKPL